MKRVELLNAINDGAVTWRRHSTGRTYRLWNGENFTLVTRWIHDLRADGEVLDEDAGGYPAGSAPFGPVVLTRGGARRLGCSCDGPGLSPVWGHREDCMLTDDGSDRVTEQEGQR